MPEASPLLQVTLCWSPKAGQVHEHSACVPQGSTVASVVQGLLATGLPGLPAAALSRLPFLHPGIWGHKVNWAHRVEEGDRIELYRDLLVDPKVARRQRFKRQGKGRTGLFANRKSGSAAGY